MAGLVARGVEASDQRLDFLQAPKMLVQDVEWYAIYVCRGCYRCQSLSSPCNAGTLSERGMCQAEELAKSAECSGRPHAYCCSLDGSVRRWDGTSRLSLHVDEVEEKREKRKHVAEGRARNGREDPLRILAATTSRANLTIVGRATSIPLHDHEK